MQHNTVAEQMVAQEEVEEMVEMLQVELLEGMEDLFK
jgi:hypothetical protein